LYFKSITIYGYNRKFKLESFLTNDLDIKETSMKAVLIKEFGGPEVMSIG